MTHMPPPPPGPPASNTHPDGTKILVLGILSLVVCGLLGPVAWVMGRSAKREMAESRRLYSNEGSITAGYICGIIATLLWLPGVILAIVLISSR